MVLENLEDHLSDWNKIKRQIMDRRDETLYKCDISLESKANIKHVILGTLLAVVVNGLDVYKLK